MKRTLSLRLRVTLTCTALLALCCILITLTNNLSAVRMADSIEAVPVLPAQSVETVYGSELPMSDLTASIATRHARNLFHTQSLLAMAAISAVGALLIYHLVGRTLSPLDDLTRQIRSRTEADLSRPIAAPRCGGEVEELADAFNQMSRRLDQVFVMQKNFSQNAAHEFRTPLAILKTRLSLFRKKYGRQPPEVEELLQIAEGEVDRLTGIVGGLLQLTNLAQNTRWESIPSDELLDTVEKDLFDLAAERHISLQTAGVSCLLYGDRELLHRAIFNLAENALKYSPEGGTVTLRVQHSAQRLCISVEDQGPGIPENLRERIFEPFFRVDDARTRQQGGTGLGLALVYAIAQFHGGTVSVSENPPGGSRFLFDLPCQSVSGAQSNPNERQAQ